MSNKQNNVVSAVKKYLETENRPFSATEVHNVFNKQSKNVITKALEELAQNKLIEEKVNGKQKIYFADQNNFQELDDNRIKEIDHQLEHLRQECEQMEKEVKDKDTEVSALRANLSPQQMSEKTAQLNEEVIELENKWQTIESKVQDFDPTLNEKVKNKRKRLVTKWIKRKRMAVQMIDTISGMSSKKPKDLMEEIGVETDEDYNVNIPQI